MLAKLRNGHCLIASAFMIASCSRGDANRITSPTAVPSAAARAEGVAGLAAEDVRTGLGTLEIVRLRLDRRLGGVSVFRQYAVPGGVYTMNPGETIEVWVERDPGVQGVPRIKVDWGVGEPDRTDFIHCGPCLLTHTYSARGFFRVEVSLDDRNGTQVTRTFFLDSQAPPPLPSPTLNCAAPTLVADPEDEVNCDSDGLYDASTFFMGSGLSYTLAATGFCAVDSAEVSINPTTGVLTARDVGDGDWCLRVIATNGCGSVAHTFTFSAFCSD